MCNKCRRPIKEEGGIAVDGEYCKGHENDLDVLGKLLPLASYNRGWRPVGKGLPEVDGNEGLFKFLVTDGETIRITSQHPSYWNHKSPMGEEFDGPVVTHWRELPELPLKTKTEVEG
jgi:hypothetical protein